MCIHVLSYICILKVIYAYDNYLSECMWVLLVNFKAFINKNYEVRLSTYDKLHCRSSRRFLHFLNSFNLVCTYDNEYINHKVQNFI